MGVIFESLLMDLSVLVAVLLGVTYWYINSNFGYWKKRGVHYLEPEPIFGNMRNFILFRKSLGEQFKDLYHQLEGHKFGGVFQMRMPFLLLRDLDLIKTIMVKDFQHFQDRGIVVNAKANPLAQHLFALGGHKWRVLRTKLSPTFTSGKMKMMFHLMEECSVQLKDYLAEPASKGEIIEMKEVLAKFTTDVIGTCAFGLQCNSMVDPNSVFRKMGRKIFEPSVTQSIRRIIFLVLPNFAKMLKITFLSNSVSKFFLSLVKETVDYREKNNVKRNDFLQLLIQLKNKGRLEDDHVKDKSPEDEYLRVNGQEAHEGFELTDELLAAQAFVFFLAGFETSSTTMSFALYELAVNPDVQDKAREEIDEALKATDGKITYDLLQNMPYLDKVVSEALRKYPPVGNLVRACTATYTIPGTSITLDKGARVVIPVYGIQNDPEYFPDPDRFDPERFSEENKAKRHHYAYLPFGEGPRICIGMRFGLMQAKIGLITLLSNYEFHVCEKTEIPLKLDPKAAVTASTTGSILKITKRK